MDGVVSDQTNQSKTEISEVRFRPRSLMIGRRRTPPLAFPSQFKSKPLSKVLQTKLITKQTADCPCLGGFLVSHRQERAGIRKEVLEGILPHSRRRGDVKSSTAGRSYNFLIGKVQKLLLASSAQEYSKLNDVIINKFLYTITAQFQPMSVQVLTDGKLNFGPRPGC
jgi:hypothetical protein